jgi:hypothetical protein
MAWSIYSHADIGSIRRPRPFGVCDRCGFVYNRDALKFQYDWAGLKEMNKGVLVCRKCMDSSQPQLKSITIPTDPVAIMNPRPGEFSGEVYEAFPDAFNTVVPSQITLESTTAAVLETIGDRIPIVTEVSSLPLLTEVTITPNPDPNFGAGGYTRMTSSRGTEVST